MSATDDAMAGMLGALTLGVTAGVVMNVTDRMMGNTNRPQRQNVGRKTCNKSCRARSYKAKQFSTRGTGRSTFNSWGGDFSNVGW